MTDEIARGQAQRELDALNVLINNGNTDAASVLGAGLDERDALRGEVAQLRAEVAAWHAALAAADEAYNKTFFPPRPPGRHTEVYDGEAAAVCRHLLGVLRESVTAALAKAATR